MYKVPGTGAVVGGGAGALAYTGADVTTWVVVGVFLVAAGVLMLVAARHRRRRRRATAGRES